MSGAIGLCARTLQKLPPDLKTGYCTRQIQGNQYIVRKTSLENPFSRDGILLMDNEAT